MKIPAYFDSFAGLVPCMATDVHIGPDGFVTVTAKVTATRGAYERGSVIRTSDRWMVPRHAVRKFRSSPFPKIMPYSWKYESADT
jgi:hypothetical protein